MTTQTEQQRELSEIMRLILRQPRAYLSGIAFIAQGLSVIPSGPAGEKEREHMLERCVATLMEIDVMCRERQT